MIFCNIYSARTKITNRDAFSCIAPLGIMQRQTARSAFPSSARVPSEERARERTSRSLRRRDFCFCVAHTAACDEETRPLSGCARRKVVVMVVVEGGVGR